MKNTGLVVSIGAIIGVGIFSSIIVLTSLFSNTPIDLPAMPVLSGIGTAVGGLIATIFERYS